MTLLKLALIEIKPQTISHVLILMQESNTILIIRKKLKNS